MTHFLFGENSLMQADKKGLTVPFSETSQRIKAQNSFNKRTELLMQCGLVKGIIPMSMRRKSYQVTLDIALLELERVS